MDGAPYGWSPLPSHTSPGGASILPGSTRVKGSTALLRILRHSLLGQPFGYTALGTPH